MIGQGNRFSPRIKNPDAGRAVSREGEVSLSEERDDVAAEEAATVSGALSAYTRRAIDRRRFFGVAGSAGLSMGAAAVLLAACGGDSASTADTGQTAGGDAAGGTPVRGGTLIEGYERDFTKMDPIQSGWADPGYYALYEFVVARDPEGRIVPSLIESEEVSPDGLTVRMKLRDGLRFQSGAPVTARVVVENFDLFRDPRTGQNAIFWPRMKVGAADDTTVVVRLEQPFAAFGETLATEYSMISNLALRKRLGAKLGATGADGTGPFTLAEFTPGKQVRVARWEEYPGSGIPFLANKGPAHLDEIKWLPLLEPSTRANEIESGSIHTLINPAPQDIDRLKGNPDLVVMEWPAPANFFISPDYRRRDLGFDDLNVRQALSAAIDREGIVQSVFFGHAAATSGPIASNYKYYEPGVEAFNQHDPEKAKSLLEESGWREGADGIREKNGTKLEFTHLDWGAQAHSRLIMEAIVPMFREIGVAMTVKTLPGTEFFDEQPRSESHGFEWLWSSPPDVLIIFNSLPVPEYNGQNAALAEAFRRWQTANSDEELEAAVKQAQLIWAEHLPKIPVVTKNSVWVHNKRVHDWAPSQTMLYPFYNDVWVEG